MKTNEKKIAELREAIKVFCKLYEEVERSLIIEVAGFPMKQDTNNNSLFEFCKTAIQTSLLVEAKKINEQIETLNHENKN